MFILEMLGAVVVVALLVGGIVNFNRWTVATFGHRFFGWFPLIVGAASVWSVIGGINWMGADAAGSGIALAIAGAAAAVGLVLFNVARTSLVVGLVGSALQLAVYTAAGLFGAAIAIPALFVAVAAAFGRAEPSMRQNHHYADHDPASAL